jgi:hypothetical protein
MGIIQALEALQELLGQHEACAVAHVQFAPPTLWLQSGFLVWPHNAIDKQEEPGYVVIGEIEVELESA